MDSSKEAELGEDGAAMNKWKSRCKKGLGGQVYEDEGREGKGVMGQREVAGGLMR